MENLKYQAVCNYKKFRRKAPDKTKRAWKD